MLEEIESEIEQMTSGGDHKAADQCRVLVCAEDDHTCNQLKEVSYSISTKADHKRSMLLKSFLLAQQRSRRNAIKQKGSFSKFR